MTGVDFTSITALFGGLTGLAAIVYAGLMVHFARKKDRDIRELAVALARVEGMLLGGKKR